MADEPQLVLFLLFSSRYSGLLLIVTFKLVMRTKYWSWFLFLSILLTTLLPYIGYMWFSNYKAILTDHILGTSIILWHNWKSLFFILFCACLILIIDGAAVSIDFDYGGYANKMRLAVFMDQGHNRNYLKALDLPIT